MKIKLIAIAAIALSPAVVFGQTRTHIRVAKDGSHATSTNSTNGDVYTAPTPAPAAEPTAAPTTDSTSTTTTDSTSTTATDSTNQFGTGAVAPTPTHSQQTDSAAAMSTDSSSMSNMKMDSSSTTTTATPTDTVRVPANQMNISPVDSVRVGIPSTRETQRADSIRRADSTKTP